MRYITFGDVRQRAIAAGLVMSRKPEGVHLRFRNPSTSVQTWSGLGVLEALEIVEAVSRKAMGGSAELTPSPPPPEADATTSVDDKGAPAFRTSEG